MRVLEDINEGELFQTINPLPLLIKGEEQDGRWIVYLEASNESLDQEGEIVVMKALKDAAKDYKSSGVISWDHQHTRKNDPEYIIGEPLDVTFSDKNRSTLIKGFLYQKNKKAQSVWNNILSGSTRFGASIGGAILHKAQNTIAAVIWRDCAITDRPVNASTMGKVQLIPFEQFAKALMAGSGVDAANYSGGIALTKESLDEKKVDATFGQTDVEYRDIRKYTDGIMTKILHGQIKSMADVAEFTKNQGFNDSVAAALIDFVSNRLPERE